MGETLTTPTFSSDIPISSPITMATESPQAGVHAVTLPTLSLRQILLVHLIIFQEALFACHVPGINISWMNQATQTDVPIALFTGEGRLHSPDTVRLNSDNAYRAVIFKHYCETFCVMMKPFITRHLYSENQGPLDSLRLWTSTDNEQSFSVSAIRSNGSTSFPGRFSACCKTPTR
jgi:hypothetical protein